MYSDLSSLTTAEVLYPSLFVLPHSHLVPKVSDGGVVDRVAIVSVDAGMTFLSWSVRRSVGRSVRIVIVFCITAPAQPSANGVPCIRREDNIIP